MSWENIILVIGGLCIAVPFGLTIWEDYKSGCRALEKRIYDEDKPWR